MLTEIELLRKYVHEPDDGNGWTTPVLQQIITANEDIYGAAADIWRSKASERADWYRVNIDGRFLDRDQVFVHYMKMADLYERRSSGEIRSVRMEVSHSLEEGNAEFA